MHRLRDQIEQAVDVAMNMGVGHGQEQVTVDQYGNARDRATDRILSLITEAMLSEKAVGAGAKKLLWICDFDSTPEERERESRNEAADVLQAALQAAGITPVDAREGGEGE